MCLMLLWWHQLVLLQRVGGCEDDDHHHHSEDDILFVEVDCGTSVAHVFVVGCIIGGQAALIHNDHVGLFVTQSMQTHTD